MSGIDWNGLLKWSTKYHDGTDPSKFKEMSEDDKGFLEGAMKEAYGNTSDPNKVVQEAIRTIKQGNITAEEIAAELERIDYCIDEPGVAENLEKLQALKPLLDLVEQHTGENQLKALEILAVALAHNPSIQIPAGERHGALQLFLRIAKEDSKALETRSKAFRALTALVNGIPSLQEQFLKDWQGVALLRGFLSSAEESKLHVKAAMFVKNLAAAGCLDDDDAKALAQTLTALLSSQDLAQQDVQYREAMAICASTLASANPACVSECSLVDTMQKRLERLRVEDDEETQSERDTLEAFMAKAASGFAKGDRDNSRLQQQIHNDRCEEVKVWWSVAGNMREYEQDLKPGESTPLHKFFGNYARRACVNSRGDIKNEDGVPEKVTKCKDTWSSPEATSALVIEVSDIIGEGHKIVLNEPSDAMAIPTGRPNVPDDMAIPINDLELTMPKSVPPALELSVKRHEYLMPGLFAFAIFTLASIGLKTFRSCRNPTGTLQEPFMHTSRPSC